MSYANDNPYASPLVDADLVPVGAEQEVAERVRREHVGHEASVQSIGVLYYVGAVVLGTAAIAGIFGSSGTLADVAVPILFLGLTVLNVWAGRGLRRLDRRVRGVAGLFSALGMLYVPIGTIINGYILYLLFSAKGRMVFSPEYQEIIRQTPHVKYRTPCVAWLLLIGAVVVLLGVIALVLIG